MKNYNDHLRDEAIKALGEDTVTAIEARNYSFRERLGQGHTRIAFRGTSIRGAVQRSCVIKVPSFEIAGDSVQAQLTNGKRTDWGLEEVLATNSLTHPNIVRPTDAFTIGDRRTVVIEDYMDGVHDAETLMQWNGLVPQKGKLKPLLLQISEGIGYLHERGIVHRDIKPSNILVGRDGKALISDLQTAKHIKDISSSSTPTRGGTSYTRPDLINALLGNESASGDYRSDIYSLGATTYTFLTGEKPFDWKLMRRDSDGSIVLKDGSIELDRITVQEHERRLEGLEKRMKDKEISRPWRNLVIQSMTLDLKNQPFSTILRYRLALLDINDTILESAWKRTGRAAKTGFITGIAATIAGATLFGLFTINSSPSLYLPPRTPELIERNRNLGLGMSSTDSRIIGEYPDSNSVTRALSEEYKTITEDTFIDKDSLFGDKSFLNYFVSNIHGIKPRLFTPIRYAVLTSPDSTQDYLSIGQDRLKKSYVPYDFAQRNALAVREELHSEYIQSRFEMEREAAVQTVFYLKGKVDDIPPIDIYAKYFATHEQIAKAQIESNSVYYFPTYDQNGSVTSPGYASALPAFERNLINRAAAAYQITEENGKMSSNKLRVIKSQLEDSLSNNNVVKGDEAK